MKPEACWRSLSGLVADIDSRMPAGSGPATARRSMCWSKHKNAIASKPKARRHP
jgi:hypothetical protein